MFHLNFFLDLFSREQQPKTNYINNKACFVMFLNNLHGALL